MRVFIYISTYIHNHMYSIYIINHSHMKSHAVRKRILRPQHTQRTTSFLHKAYFFHRFQWSDLIATSHQNHAAAAHVCTYLGPTSYGGFGLLKTRKAAPIKEQGLNGHKQPHWLRCSCQPCLHTLHGDWQTSAMAHPIRRNPSIQQPAVVHSPAMSRGKCRGKCQQWSRAKVRRLFAESLPRRCRRARNTLATCLGDSQRLSHLPFLILLLFFDIFVYVYADLRLICLIILDHCLSNLSFFVFALAYPSPYDACLTYYPMTSA